MKFNMTTVARSLSLTHTLWLAVFVLPATFALPLRADDTMAPQPAG